MSRKKFSWSISRLVEYEACPAKYRYGQEKGTRAPPSKALQRGIDVHKSGEDYLKAPRERKVPREYRLFAARMKDLRRASVSAEGSYAFTRDWEPTGWWDDPWLRVKMDVLVLPEGRREPLRVIDFKTGQPKLYPDQERLYKASALSLFEEHDRVVAEFWFLDHGIMLPAKPKVARRSAFLSGAQREFSVRAGRMEREKKFRPTPGAHCRFCEYSKRKGGPCRAG